MAVSTPLSNLKLFLLCVLLFLVCGCRRANQGESGTSNVPRIVSLSPALTETLFWLGLGDEVVAVSDYCHFPAGADRLPRVGTVFTPRFEAIAAVSPTVIVAERIAGTRVEELETLAPTLTYRWLSYEDVLQSTGEVGRRFHREGESNRLIASYEAALRVEPKPNRLKVLLAMAHVPGRLSEVWFIRRNSIHGRVLEAAGAVNAVDEDIDGPPHMGLEQVLSLDPDAVVVLDPSETEHLELLNDWRPLSALRAVREGRLAVVAAPELQVPGPRISRLVDRLRTTLSRIQAFDRASPPDPAVTRPLRPTASTDSGAP